MEPAPPSYPRPEPGDQRRGVEAARVSANDPGTSANPDAECPKARCSLAMDPATYTVGSWGQINYDGRGYRSFNNNAN